MTSRAVLLFLPVLLGLGCEAPSRVPYGAWEEGLTLVFENPSLGDEARRREARQQVRVSASRETEAGVRAVRLTFSSLKQPPFHLTVLHKEGGTRLLGSGGEGGGLVLPEGFPYRVSQWEARGSLFRVIGPAQPVFPGIQLPEGSRRGIWVESISGQGGLRQRHLYLPGLGEVEALQWKEGQWIPTLRLVSRGFTDAPPEPKS